MNNLYLLGVGAIVIGIILILVSFLAKDAKIETKTAFVGMIGPFPFGFGNDKNAVYFAMAITTIVFVLYFIFFIMKKPWI